MVIIFPTNEISLTQGNAMKLAIVLACFGALAAAVDEADVAVQVSDVDAAEHRRNVYYGGYRQGYGGYGGEYQAGYRGYGSAYRAGYGGYAVHNGLYRKGRSVEEDVPATDMEAAEYRRGGWGNGDRESRGGYSSWGRGLVYGGYGGHGNYGRYGGYARYGNYGGYGGYGGHGGYHG